MGCDIHCFLEAKINGRWVYVHPDQVLPNRDKEYEATAEEIAENPGQLVDIYDGRNYQLFAMLADVRNGIGFAGCDTGDRFEPIHEPRGMPDDASTEVAVCSTDWGGDGHSHSHATLAEAQAYWAVNRQTKARGIVDALTFAKWNDDHAQPVSSCGGIFGRGVRTVSNDEMRALVTRGVIKLAEATPPQTRVSVGTVPTTDGNSYYTSVEWTVSYRESAGEFLSELIPAVEVWAATKHLAADDVRFVYFFDN